MIYYEIITNTSYQACSMAKLLIERIKPENIKKVRLNTYFDATADSTTWPCIFTCNISDEVHSEIYEDFEIRILELESGDESTGTRELIEILRIAGFGKDYISDEEIYNHLFDNHEIIKQKKSEN